MEKWYGQSGEHSDVVLMSEVSLKRNIDGIPFPVRLNTNEKKAVNAKICSVISAHENDLRLIDMAKLYPYEAASLAELSLITPAFASSSEGHILLLSEDEKIKIMLCEEDHINIRASEGGLAPEKAYAAAYAYDKMLNSGLHFAFDPKLGYLNQNPIDLGTGLRVSVVLHLPALSAAGKLSGLASTVSKLGLRVCGAFGDGLAVKGDMVRIINLVSMGISEEEAISNLKSIALQLATEEHRTAEKYVTELSVKDKINRAMGLLQNAVLLSTDEMTEALSWVRLGVLYGLCEADISIINELFVTMQPACIHCLAGARIPAAKRDEIRAYTVREKLFGAR